MIPWEHLGTGAVPGGGEPLRLMRRGTEYAIVTGATELMNSRLGGSEEALAAEVCDRLRDRPAATMLIGGLGMGFTLRMALARLGRDARVEVAELVPAVIAWARGPLAPLFAGCLDDPRVVLMEGDVEEPIRVARARYDAILLDVDNGPDGLVRPQNDRLYADDGLVRAKAALRPGGILAVWSSAPDPRFTARLRRVGFHVTEVRPKARRGGGGRHVLWLASRPPSAL